MHVATRTMSIACANDAVLPPGPPSPPHLAYTRTCNVHACGHRGLIIMCKLVSVLLLNFLVETSRVGDIH